MNLSKEEIQKLVLLMLLVVGAVYLYSTLLLDPLQLQDRNETKRINDLMPKISAAQAQISKTKALQAKAPDATKELALLVASTPKGAPLAWFPPRLAEFFKQHDLGKVAVRLNDESPDPELSGFRQLKWVLEVPKCDLLGLGKALADLENCEPLLEIDGFQVEPITGEPMFQKATINLLTTVKQ